MKLHFTGPLGHLFDRENLTRRERKNLYFLTLGGIMGSLCCVVCGSGTSALTSLANFLGAGDFVYGVLTAVPMLAALLQIPYSILVSRTHRRRHYMVTYALAGRAAWILVGLVPLIMKGFPFTAQLTAVLALVAVSACLTSFINVCWMPWMADASPVRMRGRWMSIKDSYSNVCMMLFGLAVGRILDKMPGIPGYVLVFSVAGAFGVIDMLAYFGVDEVFSSPPEALKIGNVLRSFLADRQFALFTVFWMGWCFFANMSGMYYTRYAVNEMGITYTQVTIFGTIVSSFASMLAITRWGRLIDRYGARPVLWVTTVVGSLTPMVYLTSVPGSVLPMLFYNLLGALMWSGSNLSATSIQLSATPPRERASYIAIFSCVCNIFGAFLGILAGGGVLELLEGMGFGPGRYKIMFFIASILRFAFVLLLLPRLKNDRGYTVKDMLTGKA